MPNEIFIENLPLKVDASMLINIFKREGRIISCNIDVDKHLVSLGKGCIVFDNPSSAYHAVKIMDGQNFHGGKIRVSLTPSNFSNGHEASNDFYNKIFVKNIPPHWDDCDLMTEFRKFGDIKAAQISMTNGRSNYFGFVIFKNNLSAKAAVMNKYLYLVVKPYIPKPVRYKTTSNSVEDTIKKSTQYNNLHVKNLPEDMDDSALEELFEKFGTITSVLVARDKVSGKSLKFGFVCFVSEMDAEEARSAMNGYTLNSKQLVVNFHQKKEARKQYLEKRNSDEGSSGFEGKDITRETDVEWMEQYFDRKVKDLEEEKVKKINKELERIEKDFQKKERDALKKEKDVLKKVKGAEGNGRGIERKEKSRKRKEKRNKKNGTSPTYF